jgi:hypothetical protein
MPPGIVFNSLQFSIEIVSTITIAILAFLIFKKTKELESLSGKNSIKLFRYSFLFFSFAYISRFFLMSFKTTIKLANLSRHLQGINMFIFLPLVIFFSLVAIMLLTSSVMKRLREKKHIILFACLIGFLASVISFLSQAVYILLIVELSLFIISFILIYKQNKNSKRKKNRFQRIYVWLFLAWIMSIISLIPIKIKPPHELVLVPHIISIIIFSVILRKIIKWIK